MWSLIVSTGVGFITLLFVRQDLRRKNVDEDSKILADYEEMPLVEAWFLIITEFIKKISPDPLLTRYPQSL